MRKDDGSYRTYDEMVADGIDTKAVGIYTYTASVTLDQATSQGEPFPSYMYTIFLPEVAVNTETGKVRVRNSPPSPTSARYSQARRRRQLLRRPGPGHRPRPHRGLRGPQEAHHPRQVRHPLPERRHRRHRGHLPAEPSAPERPLRRLRLRRGPAGRPAPGHPERHLQRHRARITRVPALPEVVLEALKKVNA